jgi:hypothetical protein
LQELHRKAAALRELEAEVSKAIDELLGLRVWDAGANIKGSLEEHGHSGQVTAPLVLKVIAPLRKRVGK